MARFDDDTIVAIATPPGRGALAVVRVSGTRAHGLCKEVLDPWPAQPRRATLCTVRDPANGVIDQVVAVVYTAPRSFTGEDAVELTGHGGPLSPVAVAGLLLRRGARQAQPGEFTQRAVLNGKMDLLQAESIADLVDAQTEAMRRAALFHLDGGLSARIAALRANLLELEALLAYEIDFPEEDDGPVAPERLQGAIDSVQGEIGRLLATAGIGEVVRTGAIVAIAGRPNVGKSSLFNALIGYQRAIVTDIPGTTRDALEAVIESNGWPLRLVDTAGLRDTSDIVEREGVQMSRRYLNTAHVALVCDDDTEQLPSSIAAVREMTSAPIIAVHTKVDLAGRVRSAGTTARSSDSSVSVSVITREGLPELLFAVARVLGDRIGCLPLDAPVLTRARHRAGLECAGRELDAFREVWRTGAVPMAVGAVHVRAATAAVDELIGGVSVEDVLERVFAAFCIGK
jgi:tRNA modification GTPase